MLVLALMLVRALPASPSLLLSRFLVFSYLLFRLDYRKEIRRNYRLICGRDSRWFWLRNAWCLGRNLSLMASIGTRRGQHVIDKTVVCGDNHWWLQLEQELHAVMASFHFGAWEFLPQVIARLGVPVGLGVGAQRDAKLQQQLRRFRTGTAVRVERGLLSIRREMEQTGVTGFMLDNTSRGRRTVVTVDDVNFALPNLPFRIARSRGMGLAPAFCRFGHGRVRVRVYPPGDEEGAVRALLREVRAHPEEWVFWAKAGAVEAA